MAPEDVLSNVDEGRRDFLKKVITGTTFALPLMASFSMEGLSINPAEAAPSYYFCPNQTPTNTCCYAAELLLVALADLASITGHFMISHGGPPVNTAFQLFSKSLTQMQQWAAEALEVADSDCRTGRDLTRYRQIKLQIDAFFTTLNTLCGPTVEFAAYLNQGAGFKLVCDDLLAKQPNCQTAVNDAMDLLDKLTTWWCNHNCA